MGIEIRIGDSIRLPNWKTCVVEIQDIGLYSCWGPLVDVKSGLNIMPMFIVPLAAEWSKVLTAKDVVEQK